MIRAGLLLRRQPLFGALGLSAALAASPQASASVSPNVVSANAGIQGADSTGAVLQRAVSPAMPEMDSPSNAAEDSAQHPLTGFEVGLRLAAEVPFGKADGGAAQSDALRVRTSANMRDSVIFGVPLVLDLGVRVTPHWLLALNLQAGTGVFGDGCPADTACSWSEYRVGMSAVHFLSDGPRVPWIGIGLGWEWLRLWNLATVVGSPLLAGSRELLGGPQLSVLGGLDFLIDSGLRIGPYASFAGGTFLTSHQLCRGGASCEANSDVEAHRLHAWLSVGVRGSYGP